MVGSLRPGEGISLQLKRFVFPFLAFFVPLLFRAIPELLMSPYLVGFDTIAHYVPTTLLFLRGDLPFVSFFGTAPLFYSIIISLVFSGGSLVAIIKVVSVVLEGLLGLSIYLFAQKGLDWSAKKSMASALLGTLYFVALRISMDSLRNMLGIGLFFVVLTIFSLSERQDYSWKRYVLLSLSMVAVVLSHQLVSVIMLGVFLFTFSYKCVRGQSTEALHLFLVYLPAASLFLFLVFLVPSVSEFRILFGFSNGNDGWLALFGFSSYPSMLLSEAGFFLFCFLPLLSLVLMGIRRLKNFQIRSWIVVTLILLFVPLVSPSNLRWDLILTYPLAFCAIEGLTRLKSVSWKRFRFNLRRIGRVYMVLMVSVSSFGFVLMAPPYAFPYFTPPINAYIYQMPSSMLQNTVSISDCQDTVNALQWFKTNVDNNAVLLTHRAFYGWAMLANVTKIVLYEYDNPEVSANTLLQSGQSKIYLIWWINGKGWYGQPNVPSSFEEAYHSGEVAIYSYQPT
jgi:hypothetical protein